MIAASHGQGIQQNKASPSNRAFTSLGSCRSCFCAAAKPQVRQSRERGPQHMWWCWKPRDHVCGMGCTPGAWHCNEAPSWLQNTWCVQPTMGSHPGAANFRVKAPLQLQSRVGGSSPFPQPCHPRICPAGQQGKRLSFGCHSYLKTHPPLNFSQPLLGESGL